MEEEEDWDEDATTASGTHSSRLRVFWEGAMLLPVPACVVGKEYVNVPVSVCWEGWNVGCRQKEGRPGWASVRHS